MTPFRLALVGAGKITAGSHLPAALALPDVEIVALVDPVADRARDAAAWFGRTLPHAARVDDVLARVDGVVIGTPNHTHHAIAKTCLEAGVATLVEKPLAETVEDGEELVRIARAKGAVLQSGYCQRFSDLFAVLQAVLREGACGAPMSFFHQYGTVGGWAPLDGYSRGKGGGGGVLTVTGTHFLDQMTAWFGDARVLSYRDDGVAGPEANCIALVEFAGGVRGKVQFSKTARLANATVIRTDRGRIMLTDEVVFRPEGSTISHRLALPDAFAGFVGKNVFERQLEDFIGAVRERREPRVNGEAGVKQIHLLSALYAAREPLHYDWRGEARAA